MDTPTRIRWPRSWGKGHRHNGAIPRTPGTLPITSALHDVCYNECRPENARLIVFVSHIRDAEGGRLYTLAIQDKEHPRTRQPRWPGHHTILMAHRHIKSIDMWVQANWHNRADPNGWRPFD